MARTPRTGGRGRPGPPDAGHDAADVVFLRRAIALMRRSLHDPSLGPFGAVVVKDGELIGEATNRVLADGDPTAHAEIGAIRGAARRLGRADLGGAVLYSSAECCPMCYAAACWAGIGRIRYASRWADYADLFADAGIGADLARAPARRLLVPARQLLREEALTVWEEFRRLPAGARYGPPPRPEPPTYCGPSVHPAGNA